MHKTQQMSERLTEIYKTLSVYHKESTTFMKHSHNSMIRLSDFIPRGHEDPIIERHLPLCINTACLLCSALPLPLLFIFSFNLAFEAYAIFPIYVFS